MNHPAFPPCSALQATARVVEQEQMARNTFRLRLHCPEIARRIIPGQFFMVRPARGSDPLLGRPFALFDTYDDEHGQPVGFDFGYVTVGKLTGLMPSWKVGDEVSVWGPLGNGFPVVPEITKHLMCVAGGIGQTPFLAVARELLTSRRYGSPAREVTTHSTKVSLCYGARSADYLAGLDQFAIDGLDVRLATDDGSRGHHGFVTELLKQSLASDCPPDLIYCCGPEPMMHAVQKIATAANVACWLSLETPMACGIGICFSCVAKIQQDDGEWDYRRTCLEGPVFPAAKVVF
ncbi:dihydroorotate dehydrogenase [Planctomycetia bacterium]|nr:dihydroorotate dehydrogenase [Planctomycetia bacterium]